MARKKKHIKHKDFILQTLLFLLGAVALYVVAFIVIWCTIEYIAPIILPIILVPLMFVGGLSGALKEGADMK